MNKYLSYLGISDTFNKYLDNKQTDLIDCVCCNKPFLIIDEIQKIENLICLKCNLSGYVIDKLVILKAMKKLKSLYREELYNFLIGKIKK